MSIALLVMYMWAQAAMWHPANPAFFQCEEKGTKPWYQPQSSNTTGLTTVKCFAGNPNVKRKETEPYAEIQGCPECKGDSLTIPPESHEIKCWGIREDKTPGFVPCPEPQDVPAVPEQAEVSLGTECVIDPIPLEGKARREATKTCHEVIGHEPRWTCSDRSRILLTAEDGSKHCVKFGAGR